LDLAKSQFFANISHELKTPLSLIKISVDVLLNQSQDLMTGEDVREKYKIVERNSRHLQELINEILDLEKLEAGKMVIKKSPVLLNEMLLFTLSHYEHLIKSHAITLHTEMDFDDELKINVDHSMLSKVVNNLLSNALNFTPKGGLIQVKAKLTSTNQLEILVKDSGTGIHPEDLPKIFNRFYQSERNESNTKGNGIGLALCKELTELQGGILSVKSEVGDGSEFKLLMPVEIYAAPAELVLNKKGILDLSKELSQTLEKYQNKFDLNIPKLVIVEDHYEMQQLLHELMSPYFETIVTSNGQEALEVIRNTKVDLLISDLMMPIMDGYELLECMKNQPKLHHISIIMLTARGAAEDKLKALSFGIDDYITKPFDQQELILRVLNLINNRIILFEKSEIKQDGLDQAEVTSKHYKERFGISEREFEVMQLMKHRFSNDEIADKLFVSVSTVKFHLHNIFSKLDVKKRKEAYITLGEFEGNFIL
jgi:DNA-binding NarL/FixJ family response regulator